MNILTPVDICGVEAMTYGMAKPISFPFDNEVTLTDPSHMPSSAVI